MNKEKFKFRIIDLGYNRYMVQRLGMWITPKSNGDLVPARANEFKVPVDYETAMAYIEKCKPKEKKDVVYEIEF